MHQLGKLIQRIQDENGWSNVDIANRAIERGHKTSKQSIGEYKNKPVVSINARQINLLSDALGVGAMTVVRAAAESMGIEDQIGSSDELEQVVRTTTELSERDKRLVMSLLDAMRTDESSEHDTGKHQPDSPNLRAVSEDHHAEDAEPEQKIVVYPRDLEDGIELDQLTED
jgi:hypothetical protein